MKTELSPELLATPEGEEANNILRTCVHCGFCNATCPTYQLLGDEKDGPRGRIYLIKQLLEGKEATEKTPKATMRDQRRRSSYHGNSVAYACSYKIRIELYGAAATLCPANRPKVSVHAARLSVRSGKERLLGF